MPESNEREMTYGEKAVGLNFNPSGDDEVSTAKETFAELIDLVESKRTPNDSRFANSLKTAVVQQLVLAQMAVVKVLTWKE